MDLTNADFVSYIQLKTLLGLPHGVQVVTLHMSFFCLRHYTALLINSPPSIKSSRSRQSVRDHSSHFPSTVRFPHFFLPGDSYVAVTGLPKPQERHALLMARFAWDCLLKFEEITRELETTLGPDTTELGIRFGMHSGT